MLETSGHFAFWSKTGTKITLLDFKNVGIQEDKTRQIFGDTKIVVYRIRLRSPAFTQTNKKFRIHRQRNNRHSNHCNHVSKVHSGTTQIISIIQKSPPSRGKIIHFQKPLFGDFEKNFPVYQVSLSR